MAITINGTTGIAGVDGSASTPSYQGSDTNTGIFYPAADTIGFAEGGAEVARFDSSGNLLVGNTGYGSYFSGSKNISLGVAANIWAASTGTDPNLTLTSNAFLTSTPDYKYIVSDFASQYEQYNGAHVWATAASGTAGNTITFTERARITSGGALLVNRTTQANTERFSITGNSSSQCMALTSPITGGYDMCNMINGNGQVGVISTSGTSTAYTTSSDYRLKENVARMTGALAIIGQLNPVTYTWKVDGSVGQGFIAHELQAVVPDAVSGEKDAVDADGKPRYQGVDTSFLVATLTAAIQELKAELDTTKARLAALEAK